jgi:hypothetical protein
MQVIYDISYFGDLNVSRRIICREKMAGKGRKVKRGGGLDEATVQARFQV